jgi:Ca-activated chloride channel family protein
VGAAVEYRIFRKGELGVGPLVEVKEASPRLALAPGSYVVEARLGLATARQDVEVGSERPTRAVLALNAGAILLTPGPGETQAASPTAVISIEEASDQGAGPGRIVWMGSARERELVVPPGTYRLTMQDRQFRSERVIVVQAGSRGTAPLASAAGRIVLEARDHARAEHPSEGILFRILEDDPSVPEGRREVARSAARQAQFTLPAGIYHIVARKGAAEARELIALRSGDDVRRTLVLRMTRLALSARLPGAPGSVEEPVSFRVSALDENGAIVARIELPHPQLELPAGRYRVEARLGRLNATASREIELREGIDQELTFEPPAASVRLRLAHGQGAPGQGEVFWEVRDAANKAIWRTMEAEPRGILEAGRYTIRAELRERRIDKVVELRAGENRVLEIAPE